MSSFLRSWLSPLVGETAPNTSSPSVATPQLTINLAEPSPPNSEAGELGLAADTEDDDAPPPFPLPNSIQRSSGARATSPEEKQTKSGPSFTLTPANAPNPSTRSSSSDSKRMPPPALPFKLPTVSTNGLVAAGNAVQQRNTISIPSTGGLALPPSTTVPMPNVNKKGKARAKVALAPGHGALDWGQLKSSGADLRVSNLCFLACIMVINDKAGVGGNRTVARDTVNAEGASLKRRRMVGVWRKGIQHHSISPISSWW